MDRQAAVRTTPFRRILIRLKTMLLLRQLHLYAGLVLAIFLVVLAVTGGALIYKDEIWKVRHPILAEPLVQADTMHHAAALRRVAASFPGEQIRLIKFPRTELAAWHVYLEDGEAFVTQDGNRQIERWRWYSDWLGLLTDIHINLAAGRTGRVVAGVVGIITALMAVTGLVLWWPLRRRFRVGSFWPRDTRRGTLLGVHRDVGAITSPLIVLFALSGAGVVFYGASRVLFNGVFGDTPVDTTRPSVAASARVDLPDAGVLDLAKAAMAGARMMSYYPPPVGGAVHYFRMRQVGETHPNGRSMIYIDANTGTVLKAIDATRQPPGERASQWLYPLHAAKVGSEIYRVLALFAAVTLAAMAVTGPVTWLQMRRRRTSHKVGSSRAVRERSTAPPTGSH